MIIGAGGWWASNFCWGLFGDIIEGGSMGKDETSRDQGQGERGVVGEDCVPKGFGRMAKGSTQFMSPL